MSITKNNTKVNNQFTAISKYSLNISESELIKGGTVKTIADWIDDEY